MLSARAILDHLKERMEPISNNPWSKVLAPRVRVFLLLLRDLNVHGSALGLFPLVSPCFLAWKAVGWRGWNKEHGSKSEPK